MNKFQEIVYHMFRNQKLDTKTIAERIYKGDEAGVERALHAAQEERHRIAAARAASLAERKPPA